MKTRPVAAACVLMLIVSVPIACSQARGTPATSDARFALVIGNANYEGLAPLPGCTASTQVVTTTLRSAGFDVTERFDQSNGQMSADLSALTDETNRQSGASVVLYICGYAMDLGQRPFLLPVSAAIERPSDALTEGLVAKSVLEGVKHSKAGAGLILFDTIARPGSTDRLSFASLTNGSPERHIGTAVATTTRAPRQGAMPLAAALSAVLTGHNIEVGAVLKALQMRISASAGTGLAVMTPASATWLDGGPAAIQKATAAPASASASGGRALKSFPGEAQMSDADRRQVQTALLHLGYYDGQVDGIFGPDTRAAIRRFQHEIGVVMTGKITPAQVSRLMAKSH